MSTTIKPLSGIAGDALQFQNTASSGCFRPSDAAALIARIGADARKVAQRRRSV